LEPLQPVEIIGGLRHATDSFLAVPLVSILSQSTPANRMNRSSTVPSAS
jgi:hypothetical protein